MKNVSLALEILSIYLAYLSEQGRLGEINKIKVERKKIYNGDEETLKKVLKDYASIIKNSIVENNRKIKGEVEIEDDFFFEMYTNSEEYLLDNSNTNITPTAIIIGGQQGSGKTGIVLKSVRELLKKKQDVAVLDLDAYRGFYKNCFKLIVNNPDSYAEITNKYTGKIMEIITEKIINCKYNFIFEGTLGKSSYTLDKLLNSKVKYNIVVRVLAVCCEESILSNFERYIMAYNTIGLGRLTTIEKHDETYKSFTERIKTIEKQGILVEVYCRNKDIDNPLMIYQTSKGDNIYKNAYEALIEGRKLNYYKCLETLKERLDKINNNLAIFQKNDKTLYELKKLNQIFSDDFYNIK